MNAVEFTVELSGAATLSIPADAASKLPKAGRARVLVLTEDDSADGNWQAAAYQQFLQDDSPEDEIYDSLK